VRKDGEPEYSFYLRNNGAGDELRRNTEVLQRFFDGSGKPKSEMHEGLNSDISTLIYASPQRALQLAKAYRVIVQEQSFTQGRDPTIEPARNVHRTVDGDTATGVGVPLVGY